jgi:hypothetical protein
VSGFGPNVTRVPGDLGLLPCPRCGRIVPPEEIGAHGLWHRAQDVEEGETPGGAPLAREQAMRGVLAQ